MYENLKQCYPEEIPPADIRICSTQFITSFYKTQLILIWPIAISKVEKFHQDKLSKGNGPNGAITQVTITRILSAASTKNISDSFYDVAVFGCYITYMYAYVPSPAVRSQRGDL